MSSAPSHIADTKTRNRETILAFDDSALMRLVCDGDRDALAVLYDRYAFNVHGLARAILRDDGLAEEVTHDVFLGLWLQPQGYEPARGPFRNWFLRIARNRAISVLRHRRDRWGATHDDDNDDFFSRLVDPAPGPAEQAVTSVTRQEVRAGLAHLESEDRRLLGLAFFDGLTQREIAARLDRPLGTVKSQIRAAMRRLANVLEPEPEPDAGDGPLRSSAGMDHVLPGTNVAPASRGEGK